MNCKQEGCSAKATHIVYWPGQTTFQCAEHAKKIQGMGAFMGIRVAATEMKEEHAEDVNESPDSQDSGVSE